ncbi:hypothetical protein D3C80_1173730 [compost metagenome]
MVFFNNLKSACLRVNPVCQPHVAQMVGVVVGIVELPRSMAHVALGRGKEQQHAVGILEPVEIVHHGRFCSRPRKNADGFFQLFPSRIVKVVNSVSCAKNDARGQVQVVVGDFGDVLIGMAGHRRYLPQPVTESHQHVIDEIINGKNI